MKCQYHFFDDEFFQEDSGLDNYSIHSNVPREYNDENMISRRLTKPIGKNFKSQQTRFSNQKSFYQQSNKRIHKQRHKNRTIQQGKLYLDGLLNQFSQQKLRNKQDIFKQIESCQNMKQLLDKMERIIIELKSLLLSHLQHF